MFTFTYIIEHFVQLCGIHDEFWISNHIVYSICLLGMRHKNCQIHVFTPDGSAVSVSHLTVALSYPHKALV